MLVFLGGVSRRRKKTNTFASSLAVAPLSFPPQSFYAQRWSPSEAEIAPKNTASKTTQTAPWRLRYSRRLRDAAAIGAPRRPFADLLPGGHRGPVRAASIASGVLSTGGADRRIRLWDLAGGGDEEGGGGGARRSAPSGELVAVSAPLPGSVRCVASGCGLLVSGSGVDARLAVWRQRRDRGAGEEEERREEEEEEELEEEEDFDDDDFDEDRSLSSFSSSAGSDDDGEGEDDSVSRRLCAATRRLRLQESTRRRRKRRQAAAATGRQRPPPFDLSAPPVFLSGHAGPVAAVSVEEGLIYSASWDTTVRVWDPERRREEEGEGQGYEDDDDAFGNRRIGGGGETACNGAAPLSSPQCVGVVHLRDWGWSVSMKAGRLLVAEGRGAAVFDAETGKALRRVAPSEADGGRRGDAARVEGTRDGRTLLIARADGSLESVDLRSSSGAGGGKRERGNSGTTTLLLPGGPPPSGLAFDDPWIALASGRGGVALLDARRPRAPLATFSTSAAAAAAKGKKSPATATGTTASTTTAKPAALPIPRPPRRLGWSSNASVRCVEISGTWVVAGGDDGSVRSWYFGAGEGGERGREGGRRSRGRRGGRGRKEET